MAKCYSYHGVYGKEAVDKDSTNNNFWVASVTDGWQVSYNADALGNATELTIAKAKSGVAVTNKLTGWKSDAKAAELTQETSMGATGALGKHPSTVTYGWTVTKLAAADLTALDSAWVSMVGTAHKKPFIV